MLEQEIKLRETIWIITWMFEALLYITTQTGLKNRSTIFKTNHMTLVRKKNKKKIKVVANETSGTKISYPNKYI